MIEQSLSSIAESLKELVAQNKILVGSFGNTTPNTAETPASEPEAPKPTAAKGGKGKATAAPKPADPEPEPEPVDEKDEEESDGTVVTLDDVKAIFLKASQADKKGANETFEAFKSETGTNKVSDLNDAQRAELHGRFEAVIAAAAM